MRVELVAVGTELLLGDIVNGNAAWLGARLAAAGIDVTSSVVVGDNVGRIADAVTTGLSRADAVVLTGGLGPTQDDLTREGLARAAGVGIERDHALAAALQERYAGLGRQVPGRNLRQADRPVGASSLPNPKGTAPGVRLELDGGIAYALPGVPFEMAAMFDASVLPDLLARGGEPAVIVSRVVRTAGIWESEVADALADLDSELDGRSGPTLAYLVSDGQTRVRITAKAASRAEAERLIEPVEKRVRAALGPAVFGVDDDRLDVVVHRLLAARGATVGTAESLTAGLLAGALTEMPGASATFRGGLVVYATDLKESLAGVPAEVIGTDGVVSAATARALAAAARDRVGATFGLGLTGVAGPEEQEGHPAGTVFVGLATPAGASARRLRLPGDRARVRLLAVVSALDLLRRELSGLG